MKSNWIIRSSLSLSPPPKISSSPNVFNPKDLEKLIYKVKSEVLDKTGINLELELQIIGEKLWAGW